MFLSSQVFISGLSILTLLGLGISIPVVILINPLANVVIGLSEPPGNQPLL